MHGGSKVRGKRRPSAPAALSARDQRRWAGASLGVDLGGTKIAIGVVDRSGKVLEDARFPTRAGRKASDVIADIVTQIKDRWGDRLSRSRPLGVGVAGQVSPDGTVLFGPNLRWHDVPLGPRLARALDRPVEVLNDVHAATYGEWKYGAGRGADELVCLFVGTGIGGGIVTNGRLRRGANGTAGEFGHTTVERNGRKCHCRNAGCLEAYAGGWAIAERAREAISADRRRGRALLQIAGDLAAVTSETVEEAYRAGDPMAREIVEETVGYLAAGLVTIVNAVDPATIVLGGGVLAGYPALLPILAREVRSRALWAAAARLRIVPASLGPESGLVGAATFAAATTGR